MVMMSDGEHTVEATTEEQTPVRDPNDTTLPDRATQRWYPRGTEHT